MRLTGGHAFLFAAPVSLQPSLAETFALTAMQADQFPDVALRIRTHNHPDVIVLTPDGASIKIRQARQLIEQLSNKPFENAGRAAFSNDVWFVLRTTRRFVGNCPLPVRMVA